MGRVWGKMGQNLEHCQKKIVAESYVVQNKTIEIACKH